MNLSHSKLHIGYKEKYVEESNKTIFLGSEIDNHIKWEDRFKQGISTLIGAGFAVRSVFHFSNVHSHINILCILSFC